MEIMNTVRPQAVLVGTAEPSGLMEGGPEAGERIREGVREMGHREPLD